MIFLYFYFDSISFAMPTNFLRMRETDNAISFAVYEHNSGLNSWGSSTDIKIKGI